MTRGRRPGQRIGPYAKKGEQIAEATPQRKARLHMGLTQAELAAQAGVTLKTVRRWEAGKALAWRTESALSSITQLPLWLHSQFGATLHRRQPMRDGSSVPGPGHATGAGSLVLSLFPGADLFGRGFEAEGYSVVRGPDVLWGGDVRGFHVPAGRFDGVIGGPPCPDFSRARRGPPTGYGVAMLQEFARVVLQAAPDWWLMENVPGVPDVRVPGYSHQRLDLNARDFGLSQNRPRHFQFGHRAGLVLCVTRGPRTDAVEACCVASEASRGGARRDWATFCALQGLPPLELPGLTLSARYRAVGNGVAVPVARALARGIAELQPATAVRVCTCGCGRRLVTGALHATAACRKRMQRRRYRAGVTELLPVAIDAPLVPDQAAPDAAASPVPRRGAIEAGESLPLFA